MEKNVFFALRKLDKLKDHKPEELIDQLRLALEVVAGALNSYIMIRPDQAVGVLSILQALMKAVVEESSDQAMKLVEESLRPLIEDLADHGLAWTREEAAKWVDNLELGSKDQVICMFGYGDGVCYEELSSRAGGEAVIIVYEPETDSILDLKEQLSQNVDYYRLENLVVCSHPGYDKLFEKEYEDFIHAINENRERVLVNKNTLARFKDTASRNVLSNLHILKEAYLVNQLADIVTPDVPVIIVSAGPSLDKNIDLLKKAKGHCLIFAVDTAMKYLLSKDIMPDLGITVEPIKPMANYEDDRCFDVPHIFDCESNPEIVGRHRAAKFIYNCRDYMKLVLEAEGIKVPKLLASGGSVATSAFAVCWGLGSRNIILIGQDLAYAGEATHAGGIESKGINNEIGTVMVDGALGGQVRTRSDWLGYLRWFENAIRVAEEVKPDLTVIDATEGGALIHGSKVMSLEEALDTYCIGDGEEAICSFDFADRLRSLRPLLDQAGWERVSQRIRASFDELADIKDSSARALAICRRLIEAKVFPATELKELESLRRKCEGALMYPLINNYAVSDIAEEVSRLRGASNDSLSLLKQQALAFEAIAGACDYFEKLCREVKL